MELYEPIELGPFDVTRLSLTLPNLKFPLDLSGGVPQFRHRRGDLAHATLRTDWLRLARFFERRVGDVIGPLRRPLSVFARPQGIGVGLVAEHAALAFDLLWVPDERHARFVVSDARGVGLDGAALGFALRALDGVFAGLGERQGRVVSILDAGARPLGPCDAFVIPAGKPWGVSDASDDLALLEVILPANASKA